ncbi:hypothetical protein CF70_017925 [Cupriavidus sp. SK-3]|uniref:hypothetical protein n=1 Tax=Cupriavidus sp. SK-3 TaxID=1470558 RepID=UPI0004521DF1|nr:hypothetical protein [Cupriavidus sp. SK-3]KDP84696.1 hypothetical protein CF70_017925 [Cupriavidus sp. SK-3]
MATVSVDVDGVVQAFGRQQRQMPFAAAVALTRLAKLAQGAETSEIMRVFDNPVPFTRNAVATTPANKTSLESSVFIKDRQARYLRTEVEGGKRELKKFEQLFGKGIALPSIGARLNQYGNVTRDAIKKIAAELQRGSTSARYFMGQPKGTNLPAGIYDRGRGKGRKLRPVLIFAGQASYEPRFRFVEVARVTAAESFAREMLQAWEQALATAR